MPISIKHRTFKLQPCSPRGRDDEHRPKRASKQCEDINATKKVLCTKFRRESPVVEISSPSFKESKAQLLVDTGADVNIIKLSSLDEDILVSQNEAIEIAGITQNKI